MLPEASPSLSDPADTEPPSPWFAGRRLNEVQHREGEPLAKSRRRSGSVAAPWEQKQAEHPPSVGP